MKDDVNPLDLRCLPHFWTKPRKEIASKMPFELDTFQIASKWMGLLTCFGQVEPFHFAGANFGVCL